MNDVWMKVLERLRVILDHASTVVIAQYKLYERDVSFFTNLKRMDLYDPSINSMRYRYEDTEKEHLWFSLDFDIILFRLF